MRRFHDVCFQGYHVLLFVCSVRPHSCFRVHLKSDKNVFNYARRKEKKEGRVSLLVQESEQGGDFEYCPNIRSAENENFDDVKAALNGDRSRVKVLKLKEGDLQIFRGRHSLHRVTPAKGKTPRIIALPTYVTDPYHVNRPHHAKAFYGRAMPIHIQRERTRLDGLTD